MSTNQETGTSIHSRVDIIIIIIIYFKFTENILHLNICVQGWATRAQNVITKWKMRPKAREDLGTLETELLSKKHVTQRNTKQLRRVECMCHEWTNKTRPETLHRTRQRFLGLKSLNSVCCRQWSAPATADYWRGVFCPTCLILQ